MQYVLCSIFLLSLLSGVGCENSETPKADAVTESCRGVYTYRDRFGDLKKKNEYFHSGLGHCVSEFMALTNFEEGLEKRRRTGVTCQPQAGFPSINLRSANNFYTYRDSKVFLNFDSATGEYRKIVLGEGKDDSPTYSRTLGCFWQRTGTGIDAGFGEQLYLDGPRAAASDLAHRNEIFRYTIAGSDVTMTRFDASDDWDFTFCPYLNIPFEFCEELRDGNIMFWPDLPIATKTALQTEAILIRKEFNYVTITNEEFESLWATVESTRTEQDMDDWKFAAIHWPDEPPYTWQAWRDYVTGDRPTMPDVNSNQIPPICYDGRKEVTLDDGSTGHVNGEICIVDGIYTFTQF